MDDKMSRKSSIPAIIVMPATPYDTLKGGKEPLERTAGRVAVVDPRELEEKLDIEHVDEKLENSGQMSGTVAAVTVAAPVKDADLHKSEMQKSSHSDVSDDISDGGGGVDNPKIVVASVGAVAAANDKGEKQQDEKELNVSEPQSHSTADGPASSALSSEVLNHDEELILSQDTPVVNLIPLSISAIEIHPEFAEISVSVENADISNQLPDLHTSTQSVPFFSQSPSGAKQIPFTRTVSLDNMDIGKSRVPYSSVPSTPVPNRHPGGKYPLIRMASFEFIPPSSPNSPLAMRINDFVVIPVLAPTQDSSSNDWENFAASVETLSSSTDGDFPNIVKPIIVSQTKDFKHSQLSFPELTPIRERGESKVMALDEAQLSSLQNAAAAAQTQQTPANNDVPAYEISLANDEISHQTTSNNSI